jgi:hypothetical protein
MREGERDREKHWGIYLHLIKHTSILKLSWETKMDIFNDTLN